MTVKPYVELAFIELVGIAKSIPANDRRALMEELVDRVTGGATHAHLYVETALAAVAALDNCDAHLSFIAAEKILAGCADLTPEQCATARNIRNFAAYRLELRQQIWL